MSVFLDILRCFCCCCCCDDPDYDKNFREIYTSNNSARYRFSNVSDSNSSRRNQTDTSAVTPLLYDHNPNYYKEKKSTLEKSNLTSYNAETSSPKPSSQPVASLNGKSTLSSHLTPSGSINASLSSSSSHTNSLPSTSPGLQTTLLYLSSPSPLSSGLTQSSVNQLVSSSKLPTPTPKPSKTSSLPSPSNTSFPKPPPTSNPTLRPAPSSTKVAQEYILDAKSSLPLYIVPKDVEDLIKDDIAPQVLISPLSPLTYKSYFAALLYAEDFYYKKWSDYKLKNVSVELQQITIHRGPNKKTKFNDQEKVNKTFVAFEIDCP